MDYVADFETTIEEDKSRVWAWAYSQIGNVTNWDYDNNIQSFIYLCRKGKENKNVYFHNLKFDGFFLIDYLLKNGFRYSETKEDNTFNTIISKEGAFYQIEVVFKKLTKKYKKVTFLDSLKKLPFTVKQIAKAFGLPIEKGDLDYKLERPEGWVITEDEKKYIKNDVQIVAMALGIQFEQGLTKMTIGSDALSSFKDVIGKQMFNYNFPLIDNETHEDIKRAYRGGFTYVSERYQGKDVKEGLVFDVNSLYPSVMYDSELPFGEPEFFQGKYEYDENYPLYIQKFKCTFELKKDKIPTIQIKNDIRFKGTEYLKKYDGMPVTLYLTNVDLELFYDHYDVEDEVWLSGYKFQSCVGIFRDYIDYWMKIKETTTGAVRLLAKLMLNSLYGKFSTNIDVTGKYPVLEDGIVKLKDKEQEFRKPVYMPMGVFITSWARHKTITTAQSVYERFIYADTDSIHLEGAEIPDNIDIHPTKQGLWCHEGTFTRARFVRPKTYIEEIEGKLHVTCSGMPDNVKEHVTWDNFHEGLVLHGKLAPKKVKGGIVLVEGPFSLNRRVRFG